ncbi:A2 protein [Diplonema papillatum]|nr:A2 protein [Diplonema papillatum]
MRAWALALLVASAHGWWHQAVSTKWTSDDCRTCSSLAIFDVKYYSQSGEMCRAGVILFPRSRATYVLCPFCDFGADELANATVAWKRGWFHGSAADGWGIKHVELSLGGSLVKLWNVETNDFGGTVSKQTPLTFVLLRHTAAPDTIAPLTDAPLTIAPVTDAPDTIAPITEAPDTIAPITEAPDTIAPITEAPDTIAPITEAPDTIAPITEAPDTIAPITEAPDTIAPITEAPDTIAPITEAPDTIAPVTDAPPTTAAPPTDTPSGAPPTAAPATVSPGTCVPFSGAVVEIRNYANDMHVCWAPQCEFRGRLVVAYLSLEVCCDYLSYNGDQLYDGDVVEFDSRTGANELRFTSDSGTTLGGFTVAVECYFSDAPNTAAPATVPPTAAPTTAAPTGAPATAAPPTLAPTVAPTRAPDTAAPQTAAPTGAPDTLAPTGAPVTATPGTFAPTDAPPTAEPSAAPETIAPTLVPGTCAPYFREKIEVLDYGNNAFSCWLPVCPLRGRLVVEMLSLEPCCDFLTLGFGGPVLKQGDVFEFEGSTTVYFTSDTSVTGPGFTVAIECFSTPTVAPEAGTVSPVISPSPPTAAPRTSAPGTVVPGTCASVVDGKIEVLDYDNDMDACWAPRCPFIGRLVVAYVSIEVCCDFLTSGNLNLDQGDVVEFEGTGPEVRFTSNGDSTYGGFTVNVDCYFSEAPV